jgi:hypothetical protein
VSEFAWTGRLDEDGLLWFDLTLRTGAYDEEAAPEEDAIEPDDFQAPDAWLNYHTCTISSTFWEDATGVLAATPGRPFRLAATQRLTADPLPLTDPDALPAFHIYLLGHDSVAGHVIDLSPGDGFRFDWRGRIALTYAGEEEFRYEFRAELRDVTLGPVSFPDGMAAGTARRLLEAVIDEPHRFRVAEIEGRPVFTLDGR